jgi:hypothetical protein
LLLAWPNKVNVLNPFTPLINIELFVLSFPFTLFLFSLFIVMNYSEMWHDSQQQQQRKKRPLPQLPHRSASGQFISVGPCWISTSHSLTRETSKSTGKEKQ